MFTALEIARQANLKPIDDIAATMGISPSLLEHYGDHIAKIKLEAIDAVAERPRARYVVVLSLIHI